MGKLTDLIAKCDLPLEFSIENEGATRTYTLGEPSLRILGHSGGR